MGYRKVLIVIDVQPGFIHDNSHDKEIKNCAEEVKIAKKSAIPIIIVEFSSFGSTLQEVTKPISRYKNKHLVQKFAQGGGEELKKYLIKKKIFSNCNVKATLRVCGFWTDQCVKATIIELSEKFPQAKIELVEKATSAYCSGYFSLGNRTKNTITDIKKKIKKRFTAV